MRIAHVSDLHVLAPLGAELRSMLFNKRITGLANLLLKRGRAYRQDYLAAVLRTAAAHAEQLVVTGDITNLSLEGEYRAAERLLAELSRSTEVTVVPGNHDVYLPAIHHERRFVHHFRKYMASDLPELALDLSAGAFPSVKLRGPAAIIGLTSAVPRAPFVSGGYLGHPQLEALARVLAHREVARRMPIVLVHHSPFDTRPRLEQLRSGLADADALRSTLAAAPRGLLLYGHLHVRSRSPLPPSGWQALAASAAALDHPSEHVRAGYNLIELDEEGGLRNLEAHVLHGASGRFEAVPLPLIQGRA
jgi:3',5'-cyclic AMP phosphodiesterase CpdA